MRVAYNDSDDRAGLCGYAQFNKYKYLPTYIHTYIHTYMHTYISSAFQNRERLLVGGPCHACYLLR